MNKILLIISIAVFVFLGCENNELFISQGGSFDMSVTSVEVNEEVSFSINATANRLMLYTGDYSHKSTVSGDYGTTLANGDVFKYRYTEPGVYEVVLRLSSFNEGGADMAVSEIKKTITVTDVNKVNGLYNIDFYPYKAESKYFVDTQVYSIRQDVSAYMPERIAVDGNNLYKMVIPAAYYEVNPAYSGLYKFEFLSNYSTSEYSLNGGDFAKGVIETNILNSATNNEVFELINIDVKLESAADKINYKLQLFSFPYLKDFTLNGELAKPSQDKLKQMRLDPSVRGDTYVIFNMDAAAVGSMAPVFTIPTSMVDKYKVYLDPNGDGSSLTEVISGVTVVDFSQSGNVATPVTFLIRYVDATLNESFTPESRFRVYLMQQ